MLRPFQWPAFAVALMLLGTPSHDAAAQAVKTIPCPEGRASLHSCIASHETCGWRNARPTEQELKSEQRGGIVLLAPCPTLSNGVELSHCFIDRTYYCKVPSAADIAAAIQAKREREEKARQEKLAAERRAADVAREIQRLGSHREAEARRLVEMREAAEKARPKPKCQEKTITVGGHSSQYVNSHLFTGWKTRDKALAQAKGPSGELGRKCAAMTGSAGHGAISERCQQDKDGRWECSVDTTCSAQQKLCGGQQ